jgi:hypothetical protein
MSMFLNTSLAFMFMFTCKPTMPMFMSMCVSLQVLTAWV